jgi:hypothetical protein
MHAIMPHTACKDTTTLQCLFAAMLLFAVTGAAPVYSQVSQVRANLMNSLRLDSRGPRGASLLERTHGQYYDLSLRGYVYRPSLLSFEVKTAYADEAMHYGIEQANETRNRTDFGYYDASMTLFPDNGFRLRAFGRQQRIDYANTGLASQSGTDPYSWVQNNHVYGVDLSIPRNTFYPSITAVLQRELQKCEEPCTEVYRKEDFARLTFSNSSGSGSNYRAEYKGRFRKDVSEDWASKEHQLRFSGKSSIGKKLDVHATGLMYLRDAYVNRSLNFIGDIAQSASVRHRLTAASSENRLSQAQPNRSTRNGVTHRSFITMSPAFLGIIGAQYEMRSLSADGSEQNADKALLLMQTDYRQVHGNTSLSAVASLDAGLERALGTERRFVQKSQLGGGAIMRFGSSSTLLVRNDATSETMVLGGNFYRNVGRLEVTTDVLPTLPVQVKLTRTDATFTGTASLPSTAVTTLESWLHWRPFHTITLMLHHSERFTAAGYDDRSSRSLAGLTVQNLLRNLGMRLQAERSVSSLTGYVTTRLEGELNFRFHAFYLLGRYTRDAYGSFVREHVYLELRRPISLDYR